MAVRITNSNQPIAHVVDNRNSVDQCLTAEAVERLAGVRTGDRILCTQGILWVTQEGDREDYMLKKGDQFVANRHGTVVVQAVKGEACIQFSRN